MNNNVNVFSVNTASAKEAAKPTVKAAARTVNTKQDNFSQTLDQAQQARSKNSLSKDNGQGTVSNKPEADAKEAVDAKAQGTDKADDKALAGDVAANDQPKADKSDAKAETGNANADDAKLDNLVQAGTQDAAALLAAQAQASLVQDMPMAELNTYFKGDARLQNVQDDVQVQALSGDDGLLPQMQQANNQQQESSLTSLQPAEALPEVQKVDKADNAENAKAGQGQPVESPKSYAPNDIAALLGTRSQAVSNESNVYQSPQVKGQQMLNLLAGQQGVYTAQPAVQQVQENTVSVTQLANLTDGVEVVNADNQQEIPVASVQQQPSDNQGQQAMSNGQGQQQSMLDDQGQQMLTNGQGQQQGSQLPGEASFDVVVPDQQENGLTKMYHSLEQHGLSFQQVMDNQAAVQQTDGDVSQMNQARETYNVPQQIVEQAKLLQRGTDSEMIIKLNPEHLGQLSLKVSVNGNGGVTATFHTDNAQVRAILETTMTQLKQQLDEQGIKVDNVEVQTGLPDGQLPQDQGQQGFYQQQGQEVRSQQADLKDFEESSENLSVEAEETQAQEVVLDSQGNQISRGVDYTV